MASMLSVVVADWLVSTVLQGFKGSLGGLRFGPIDTIFAVAGLLILLAAAYAYVALPRDAAAPAVAVAGPG